MVSPELLRRYPFFGGLTMDQIVLLAKDAQELELASGNYFFHEAEVLDTFYLVLEGEVASVIEVPEKARAIVTEVIRAGQVFALSALVPPYSADAAARAETACRVVAFPCAELRQHFGEDAEFGYLMLQRVAEVLLERLQTLRIESLASTTDAPTGR